MDKCETQKINICGCDYSIPAYYEHIEALPDDPKGAEPFAVATPNAQCFFIGYEIPKEQMMPVDQLVLLAGIRQFLGGNQGIIECEVKGNCAYSIVKTLDEHSGVQYTLTFQEIVDGQVIFLQGSFEEAGTTGIRDAVVFELLRQNNQLGTEDNPLEGWVRDPYDESVTTGALMNASELREFDSEFPGTALMVCRELVDHLVSSSDNRGR